jgi:2-polyprenyl-6-methoxyphenol hydroxylase-like FAD-dependent oxidoreductase
MSEAHQKNIENVSGSPQVIIVGGGPVGVSLAIELAQRNITTVVVERHEEVGRIPKGQSLMQRSLEHFYFWNCVDELRAARLLPAGYPIGGITAYESLSSDYWYLPEGLGGVGQYFFQENERLPQYRTEAVLRRRAAQLPQITMRFHTTATTITQDENKVCVTVVDTEDETITDTLFADFVVGCDGGRSIVREQAGITRRTRDFGEKMVLCVFSSTELHDGLERFPERTTYRVLHPKHHGVWQFFGRVKLGETWFFHGPVPEETKATDTEYLQKMLGEVAGFPFACAFEHIGFWDLKIDVAETYRKGRIFIAGDACHTHPPYGGLGLNTGLDDVANLGWKLAAYLAGWGGEELLASYSTERQPVFAQTGDDVIGKWIDDDAEFFRNYDPAIDEMDFKRAWSLRTGGEFAPPWYEPHYDGSSVICDGPLGDTGVHGGHLFDARPGHHLAPALLSSGRNVYEELGTDVILLAFGIDDTQLVSFRDAAAELHIPFKTIVDTYVGERARYGPPLILVRPDHYIAWCGERPPEDVAALLRQVCGQ